MRWRGKPLSWLVLLNLLTLCDAAPGGERHELRAGQLRLVTETSSEGLSVIALEDRGLAEDLLATPKPPLFSLTLRETGSKRETRLTAETGWRDFRIRVGQRKMTLEWQQPLDAALGGISVRATAVADAKSSSIGWEMGVENRSTNWSVWNVAFPQVALADLGSNAVVLFPRGPGEVQRGVWDRSFNYRGNYPDGWCSMQYMAAYRQGDRPTGIYVGTHDPWGSTKTVTAKSDPAARSLTLNFEHPAPDMGLPGNSFSLQGRAVWQLLRGDWFDAASIYRAWAMKEAKWWPRLDRDGRADTPTWMRRLNVWAMTGGAPGDCVPAVKTFQALMGEPVGFHWYNWHQIPFDNDYPHYFPAKPGFAEGVAELKSAGVYVMPYINGRLWDSHDRGAEDFEFTRLALPSVTRQEDGKPCLESYGSKETNGEPVRLGVMCPTTPLWQETVSNIVLRLLGECGTSSVYIDQVAAAAPKLCMDMTHGHPLGGGHWWCEGYWKMLDGINSARRSGGGVGTHAPYQSPKEVGQGCPQPAVAFGGRVGDVRTHTPYQSPKEVGQDCPQPAMAFGGRVGGVGTHAPYQSTRDTMLTTECNGEPFIRWFDGYLTWHWQYDGQVPAFPAVYGGAIQMFGRAYRGGATQDLALRMKAGQQLVYGEQLGWLDPGMLADAKNAEFFRAMVKLRGTHNRFFSAGQMQRPPKLIGDVPRVKADWQWSGEWWVSTDAVLTGTWSLRRERRLVLLFVNVSDAPVTASPREDLPGWGVAGKRLVPASGTPGFDRPVTFAPRQAQAWEFKW